MVGDCWYEQALPAQQAPAEMLAVRSWYHRLGGRLEDLPATATELDWLNAALPPAGWKVAWLSEHGRRSIGTGAGISPGQPEGQYSFCEEPYYWAPFILIGPP